MLLAASPSKSLPSLKTPLIPFSFGICKIRIWIKPFDESITMPSLYNRLTKMWPFMAGCNMMDRQNGFYLFHISARYLSTINLCPLNPSGPQPSKGARSTEVKSCHFHFVVEWDTKRDPNSFKWMSMIRIESSEGEELLSQSCLRRIFLFLIDSF
ncbi:endo-1 3-beta-glucanase [Striga asiatica]|uniref:Endo-1 3-beta-glucanase n=1 Tax=Striga asiatica TaxID=4170 RepID=A0A5A7PZI3_STRAF|nr:endo-1 3-beta-glucanase [Striga asiatica]